MLGRSYWPLPWLLYLTLTGPPGSVAAQARVPELHAPIRLAGEEFGLVTAILPSASGNVAVVDAADRKVVVLSVDGRLLWRLGGPGAGPGEFRSIGSAGWLGDTLWVADPVLGRITRFHAGSLVSALTYAGPSLSTGLSARAPTALLANGWQLIMPAADPELFVRGGLTTVPVLLVDNGTVLDTLAVRYRENVAFVARLGNGLQFAGLQPLRSFDDWKTSPGGTLVAVVDWRTRGSDRGVLTLHVLRASGETLWSATREFVPVRVPRRVADSLVGATLDAARAALGTRAGDDRIRPLLDVPHHYPPITGLVLGDDGSVLMRREEQGPRVQWDSWGPQGEFRGSFLLSQHVRLLGLWRSSAWGVAVDPDGVNTVRRYEVVNH